MAIAQAHASSGLSFSARLSAFFQGFKESRVKRIAYRQTVSELSSMSDRELHDLGFSRYEIQSMVHRHVYGM